MENIRSAFQKFWGNFYNMSTLLPTPELISAFPTGKAIFRNQQGQFINAQFPYITYDIMRPEFANFTITTASIWDRNPSNPGFFGLVDNVLSQISKVIPEEGILLELGIDGAIWLLRSTPFIRYLDDPADIAISRGIVSLIVRSYVL